MRPQQMLFFVKAAQIRDAVLVVADGRDDLDVVVLDLALTPDVDAPSCDALADLIDVLHRRNVELWIVTGTTAASDRLHAAGITGVAGPESVFSDVAEALLADLERHSAGDHNARAEVGSEILDLVHNRQRHPHLDEQGRRALDDLEARLRAELRETARLPDAGPA